MKRLTALLLLLIFIPSSAQAVGIDSRYLTEEDNFPFVALVAKVAQATQVTDIGLASQIAMSLGAYSAEFDINPWLMASLIRTESEGNPLAVSPVGAIGLTQIMPETGKEIARWLGVEWTGTDMLFDVDTNIRFGTRYIRYLLDRFEGNHMVALAAYNFGPTKIQRIISNNKPLPVGYANKILSQIVPQSTWKLALY